MKRLFSLLTLVSFLAFFAFSQVFAAETVSFKETWGYVVMGHDSTFDPELMSVSDLCYFSADINCYGEIPEFPKADRFPNYKGRKHLVVTCEGRSLSHFTLDPEFGVSKKVIKSIVANSKDFDGVQIDFETIPLRDAKNFQKFLKDLRKALGKKKMLTLCVPARNKTLKEDVFIYSELAPLVDRVFIMTYDQHYAGSAPGAVAEIEWANKVGEYAKTIIPQEKIIMGMPFYGRSWVSENFGKAWLFSGIKRITEENKVKKINRTGSVPNFKFKTEVTVTGFYDDEFSLLERMKQFKSNGFNKIGFWRIGQEDPEFWKHLELEK